MKWKKVSKHPLPDGDGHKDFMLKLISNRIVAHEYPKKYPFADLIIEWCEFNHDEIESADLKFYGKSVIENPDLIQTQRIEHQPEHKTKIQEPSWEEKFRWETARDIFCAFLSNHITSEQSLCWQLQKSAIELAEDFFAELKRGRE